MNVIKTISLSLVSICCSMALTHGQEFFPHKIQQHEHNGRIFIGGAVSYWHNTSTKTITLDLCPEIGYLFNDNWGAGLLLGSRYEHTIGEEPEQAYKISPFARWYYVHKEPFNLFLDAGFGYNFSKNKSMQVSGFEIGIRPGACVDLTEGLCLCLRMGFMGYRHNYFMGEEPVIGNSGFGIRFAPEELLIGLELEF